MGPVGALILALVQTVPVRALELVPVLAGVQREYWTDAPEPWTIAGAIEQETCPSATSSKCWNPRAELVTSRELGTGLGQITIAYRLDGSVRFNKFEELRQEHVELRDWTWDNRYDPAMQLRALVLMKRNLFRRQREAASVADQWAFEEASYNSGLGALLKDRRYCSHIPGCDPSRWFGHVEVHSLKSRTVMPGYGRSPYQISRHHVHNILRVRRPKYRRFWP